MTPKQILDSFSGTLMQDERILSARERALLASLLQHAKAASNEEPHTQEAVRAVIASAVGETVAHRAFSVLGASIVERILREGSATPGDPTGIGEASVLLEPQPPGKPLRTPDLPMPPAPEPQPPGVKAPRKEPHTPVRETPMPPAPEPQPPGRPLRTPGVPAPEPQLPGQGTSSTVVSRTNVAVAERPEKLKARCVVLDEFLSPQELEDLTRFTVDHESDFRTSEVVSPHAEGGVVNYDQRRSRVLMNLGRQQELLLARIKTVLPEVLQRLDMEDFAIADVEAQITASNEGDFFHFHSDNGSERVASRHLTFVYFFHREPRAFEGGELRIHDARLEDGAYVSEGSYQTIVPQQNQIVFFPCELLHEITPVKCASQLFSDSRFTLNGWLHR